MVNLVKDYARQYAVPKRLSFTAAAMAMDIFNSTFNTILPTGVNSDMINILQKVGHKKNPI